VKKTPAQNISAYTALKLGGNNPGQRLNATSATKIHGNPRCHFWFTDPEHNPATPNDKIRRTLAAVHFATFSGANSLSHPVVI
jgi:hypothetical protein